MDLKSRLASYLPQRLPQHEADVIKLAQEVCQLAGVEATHSYMTSVASSLMHLPERARFVSKHFLTVSLRRAIMNQASFNTIQVIKEEAKLDEASKA